MASLLLLEGIVSKCDAEKRGKVGMNVQRIEKAGVERRAW
jgi:hypothetical protein